MKRLGSNAHKKGTRIFFNGFPSSSHILPFPEQEFDFPLFLIPTVQILFSTALHPSIFRGQHSMTLKSLFSTIPPTETRFAYLSAYLPFFPFQSRLESRIFLRARLTVAQNMVASTNIPADLSPQEIQPLVGTRVQVCKVR